MSFVNLTPMERVFTHVMVPGLVTTPGAVGPGEILLDLPTTRYQSEFNVDLVPAGMKIVDGPVFRDEDGDDKVAFLVQFWKYDQGMSDTAERIEGVVKKALETAQKAGYKYVHSVCEVGVQTVGSSHTTVLFRGAK